MEILDSLILSYFLTSVLESKFKKYQVYAIYVIQIIIFRIALNPIWYQSSIRSPIMMVTYFLMIIFLFKGTFTRKSLAFLTYFAACFVGELCSYIFLVFVLKLDINSLYSTFTIERLFIQFFNSVFIYFAALIGIRILKRNDLSYHERTLHSITVYLLIQLLSLFIIFDSIIEYKISSPNLITIAFVVLVISLILGFVLIRNLIDIAKNKQRQEFMETEQYIRDIHYAEMKAQFKKYRELRHDFEAHITLLNALQDKWNLDEVKEYIYSIKKDYEKLSPISYCNNPVIDALIFGKTEIANEFGIKTEFKLRYPDNINIPIYEVCNIISNMLQNAIEGACNFDGEKYIKMECYEKAGFLVIVVRNSASPPKENLETIKEDKINHGIGTGVIKQISEEYNGNTIFEYKDNEFTCVVNVEI